MNGISASNRVKLIRFALQHMKEIGHDISECLQGTGLSDAELADPRCNAQFGLDQEFNFYRNLIALTGDAQLGLSMGKALSLDSFGPIAYAVTSASTVKQALNIAREYGVLAFSLFTIDYRIIDQQSGCISLKPSDKIPDDLLKYYIDRSLSFMVNIAQTLLLPSFSPDKIMLMHSGPQEIYQEYFNCPVFTDSKTLELHGNNTIFHAPMPSPDDEINRLYQQQCQILLSRMTSADIYTKKVQQQLVVQVGCFPSIEQVAEKFSMTSRTLRRRLSDEGTSFKLILDNIRLELALDYLENSNLLIEEIATQLGYNSPGNFSQAFRRLKGCSPNEYRSNHRLSKHKK